MKTYSRKVHRVQTHSLKRTHARSDTYTCHLLEQTFVKGKEGLEPETFVTSSRFVTSSQTDNYRQSC